MNLNRCGLSFFLILALASASRAADALTVAQYADLSEMAYYPSGDPNMGNATAPPGFKLLWVSSGSTTGFSASAFEHSASHAVVVAYMGTYNLKDALADIGIGEDDIGSAEDAAWHAAEGTFEKLDAKTTAFIKKAPNIALKPNALLMAQIAQANQFFDFIAAKHPGKTVTVTGHSLGGYLGQLVAARTGAYAVLFNAPGAVDMTHGPGRNMTTYIRHHDVVGTLGTHIGALKQYPDVKVDLHTATPYVYRNHTVLPLRQDIARGMVPLVNPAGMFTELTRGVEKVEAEAKSKAAKEAKKIKAKL